MNEVDQSDVKVGLRKSNIVSNEWPTPTRKKMNPKISKVLLFAENPNSCSTLMVNSSDFDLD